ncbi:hypothetical protein BJV82DRAFT_582827 [Fennellomyces sp. T-0311]|nr:hypothetical protein BJV82DRAFT_582827 [Fennellomyces sp. T-0311]
MNCPVTSIVWEHLVSTNTLLPIPAMQVFDTNGALDQHKTILPGMSLRALYNEKGVEIFPATGLDRNEVAINNEVMAGQRFYCPYEDCKYQCGERSYIFAHIRSAHDANFPKIQANRKFAVKDVHGEIVRFDGIFLRN